MLTWNVDVFAIGYASYPKILILILKPVFYNKTLSMAYRSVLIINSEILILACYM